MDDDYDITVETFDEITPFIPASISMFIVGAILLLII